MGNACISRFHYKGRKHFCRSVRARMNVYASEVSELYHTNIRELQEFENTEQCENFPSIKTTQLQK